MIFNFCEFKIHIYYNIMETGIFYPKTKFKVKIDDKIFKFNDSIETLEKFQLALSMKNFFDGDIYVTQNIQGNIITASKSTYLTTKCLDHEWKLSDKEHKMRAIFSSMPNLTIGLGLHVRSSDGFYIAQKRSQFVESPLTWSTSAGEGVDTRDISDKFIDISSCANRASSEELGIDLDDKSHYKIEGYYISLNQARFSIVTSIDFSTFSQGLRYTADHILSIFDLKKNWEIENLQAIKSVSELKDGNVSEYLRAGNPFL